MGIESDDSSECVGALVVIVIIAVVGISIISDLIYYTNLFGGIVIVAIVIGVIFICALSMLSDSSKPIDSPRTTISYAICPECEIGFSYTYESKDAFGRVRCDNCGETFTPKKYVDSDSPATQQPLGVPQGNPRSLVEGCRESEAAASLVNTRIAYSLIRKAARETVASLGMNEVEALLRAGLDYLNANRITAALACFYEAELINFNHDKLVGLRIRFNRPGQSFNDIAEEFFNST